MTVTGILPEYHKDALKAVQGQGLAVPAGHFSGERIPKFGLKARRNPEGRLHRHGPVFLVGQEVEIAHIPQRTVDKEQLSLTGIGEIGTGAYIVQYPVQRGSGGINQAFSFPVPDFFGQLLHPFIGLIDAVLHTGGTERRVAHDAQARLHEAGDGFQHLRTHSILAGQHQHAVLHPAVQHQFSVLYPRVVAQDIGVDVVEAVALRNGRIGHARHLGSILADEIGDIGHVASLLEHEVATFEVFHEAAHAFEPTVVAVEFVAEPGAAAGLAVIGLLDVQVQQAGVDAFAEETVHALFHHARIAVEGGAAGRAGFGPDLILAVDVAAGRGGAVLDVAQAAFAPEFAANLIALAAVQEEFRREAPVAVALQPGLQAVGVGLFPQAAHIVVGHPVGHQAAQVPEEALALVHGSGHPALEHRQVGPRIIAVCLFKHLGHIVGPVLAAGFVAVLHHHLPGFAIFGRDAAQQFTHKGIVMLRNIAFAHLVHLQARTFRDGRRIVNAGAFHVTDQHGPLAGRHLPA